VVWDAHESGQGEHGAEMDDGRRDEGVEARYAKIRA
jgi:hypothetical protein